MVSFREFAVVGELRIHEDLGGSSTISRFGDDVPVGQLLRSRAVSSLVVVIVDIPVVPGDVVVDVGRKIVCYLLRCLRSTARGEGDAL